MTLFLSSIIGFHYFFSYSVTPFEYPLYFRISGLEHPDFVFDTGKYEINFNNYENHATKGQLNFSFHRNESYNSNISLKIEMPTGFINKYNITVYDITKNEIMSISNISNRTTWSEVITVFDNYENDNSMFYVWIDFEPIRLFTPKFRSRIDIVPGNHKFYTFYSTIKFNDRYYCNDNCFLSNLDQVIVYKTDERFSTSVDGYPSEYILTRIGYQTQNTSFIWITTNVKDRHFEIISSITLAILIAILSVYSYELYKFLFEE